MPDLIVPWRPDGAHRDAIWSRLKQRHLDAGRTVIEGTCEGEWCKAEAVADALTRSTSDVVVVHDADVWTDGLDLATNEITSECRWAVPHLTLYRLAEHQAEPTTARTGLAQPPYTGYAGGGIVVIDRPAYDNCPMDVRFAGWGQEDESWARALSTVYGQPWRGDAPLWHWWHPAQPRQSRATGSKANALLAAEYKRARTRRQMIELIEEGRCRTSSPITPASPPS